MIDIVFTPDEQLDNLQFDIYEYSYNYQKELDRKNSDNPYTRLQHTVIKKLSNCNTNTRHLSIPKIEYRQGVARIIAQEFTCVYTGKQLWKMDYDSTSLEHLKPLKEGGDNSPDNLFFCDAFFNFGKRHYDLDIALVRSLEHILTEQQMKIKIDECYARIAKARSEYLSHYKIVEHASRKDVNRYFDERLNLTINNTMNLS